MVIIVKNGEHLTQNGLSKIVNIRASINIGLSSTLKSHFPLYIPVPRPIILNQTIPNPFWIGGFASGECCFHISVASKPFNNGNYPIQLSFSINQHIRDKDLINSFVNYFDCGL